MQHVNPHGLLFVAVQVVAAVALAAVVVRHHRRTMATSRKARHMLPATLVAGFVLWFVVLRVQPARRGADPFGYTLGVFDGVSAMAFVMLILLHVWLSRRQAPSERGKTL